MKRTARWNFQNETACDILQELGVLEGTAKGGEYIRLVASDANLGYWIPATLGYGAFRSEGWEMDRYP